MTLARSSALGRPMKVILVPLANSCGFQSQALRLSSVQVWPLPLVVSAVENAKPPRSSAIGEPTMPQRLGPIRLGPPLSKLWQAEHCAVFVLPASALADAISGAIGSGPAGAAAAGAAASS